jgi:hypothetical protein
MKVIEHIPNHLIILEVESQTDKGEDTHKIKIWLEDERIECTCISFCVRGYCGHVPRKFGNR